MRKLSWFLLLLLLGACSSLKPPVEPQAKLDADTYFNQGLKWEGLQQAGQAKQSYQNALQYYRKLADAKGVAAAMCGLARLALAEGDREGFAIQKAEAMAYVSEVEPSLGYQIVLLDVYRAMRDKDYTAVASLAEIKTDYPLSAKVQLAASKLQAITYLGQTNPSLAADLEVYAGKYRKELKKQAGNAELYSLAWYSLAFYHYGQKDYAGTLANLVKSNKIDYEYGNLIALGHGWWLKGQAEAESGKSVDALASLRKAEGIFLEYNESQALAQVQDLIIKVRGKMPLPKKP